MAAALSDSPSAEDGAGAEFAPTMKSDAKFRPPSVESLAQCFPQLEIIEQIGQGGMGAVYKARQTKLDRIVALKIVRPDNADDASFNERFDREAKTLARLNHPNIVGVYDFGDTEFDVGHGPTVLYYFLMEFVDGMNLRSLIRSKETTPSQALAITAQICDALQYAHDCGVVHRDIKPENILLGTDGRIRIADFGLAKLGGDTELAGLTGTRQVLGTLQYMAPEQMAQSKKVDHRADIYSLGVVFYEMLTGEVPAGVFEPPSKRSGVDHRLDEVVMRALASNPDQRFQKASDVSSRISVISSIAPTAAAISDPNYTAGASTIFENGVAAVAAFVKAGAKGFAAPVGNDLDTTGVSDVVLDRQQVEADGLPDVCIVCGASTKRRTSKEFQYMSENLTGVMVLFMILFFPIGIAIAIMGTRTVRGTLPICHKHRHHWSKLYWWAGLGWLLIPTGVFLGLWVGNFFGSGPQNPALLIGCILSGIAAYVIPLVYMGTTRVAVGKITDTTISLKRVAVKFARTVTDAA
ncbi:serine/threonine-protein kinase [Fuerstiella marisgermanici]|nr:serine/threonine-protein kinase [Fuerstiella marisgermanici]